MGNAPNIEDAIKSKYPNDHKKVGELAWLVSDSKAITPHDVDMVLLGSGQNPVNIYGPHIVSSFSGYWGYHDKETWEWLNHRGM
ncbi:MAG: hypothetical protein CMH98_04650 [Oceanospirillaceae bacterium]|nr:hypothetical protein [Oceanospirillaceae bacterium]